VRDTRKCRGLTGVVELPVHTASSIRISLGKSLLRKLKMPGQYDPMWWPPDVHHA